MKLLTLAWLALSPVTAWADGSMIDASAAIPPPAKQKPHARTIHGETVTDPFFWLCEKGTADVTAYLEAENAYTAAATKSLEPFTEKLYQELLSKIKQTDFNVPYRRGNYVYYSRTLEGQQPGR
jgi:oligopeptidase B